MARRCCRDSVAMKIAVHDPIEGMLAECRWCDGYARFEHGAWHFKEDESPARQWDTLVELTSHRATRIKEVLKQ